MPITLADIRTHIVPTGGRIQIATFIQLATQRADQDAANRELWLSLARNAARIDNIAGGTRDTFISYQELQLLAGLAGNATSIEAADITELERTTPLGPVVAPAITVIPNNDPSIPEAIRNYSISHTPNDDSFHNTAGQFVTTRIELGTIRLQGNQYARFWIDTDDQVHCLIYTHGPGEAAFNPATSCVREITIPLNVLDLLAGTNGLRISPGNLRTVLQGFHGTIFPGGIGNATAVSNGDILRLVIVPLILRNSTGQVDITRLTSPPEALRNILAGSRVREARGLSSLCLLSFTPLSGVTALGGDNVRRYGVDTPVAAIQIESITPASQATPQLVTDATLLGQFNTYYDTASATPAIAAAATARLGGGTITHSSGLFSLSSTRTARLIRVTQGGQVHYRLLVREAHADGSFRFEEYRLPEQFLRHLADQMQENIDFSNFEQVTNFIARRVRGDDDRIQASLYRQRGYVQLGELVGSSVTISGTTYTVQVRTSQRDYTPTAETRSWGEWYYASNGGFQGAIDSMTNANNNALTWRNTALNYMPTGAIPPADMPQALTTVPALVTQFETEVRQAIIYRNDPRIRGLHPTHVGPSAGQFLRLITRFTIRNPHRSNVLENRAVYLWNDGTRIGYFVISWVGNAPTPNPDNFGGSAYRVCFIPQNEVQASGLNYSNGTALADFLTGTTGNPLITARRAQELLQFQLFFGQSSFIEDQLNRGTGTFIPLPAEEGLPFAQQNPTGRPRYTLDDRPLSFQGQPGAGQGLVTRVRNGNTVMAGW